jgi:hypothetical protein
MCGEATLTVGHPSATLANWLVRVKTPQWDEPLSSRGDGQARSDGCAEHYERHHTAAIHESHRTIHIPKAWVRRCALRSCGVCADAACSSRRPREMADRLGCARHRRPDALNVLWRTDRPRAVGGFPRAVRGRSTLINRGSAALAGTAGCAGDDRVAAGLADRRVVTRLSLPQFDDECSSGVCASPPRQGAAVSSRERLAGGRSRLARCTRCQLRPRAG